MAQRRGVAEVQLPELPEVPVPLGEENAWKGTKLWRGCRGLYVYYECIFITIRMYLRMYIYIYVQLSWKPGFLSDFYAFTSFLPVCIASEASNLGGVFSADEDIHRKDDPGIFRHI